MIYCVNNSAAHKYAKKNHLPYTIIDPVKTSYKATDLSLSTKQISMPIGAKKRVLYQVTPVYAAKRNVKFSSSNSKVVSVNAKGYDDGKEKSEKATITVQLKSGSKKKVKWSSSKKSVASVSASGKVTGKKGGSAYICAKVGKRTLKCKVTVKEPNKSKRLNLAKKEAKKIVKNMWLRI